MIKFLIELCILAIITICFSLGYLFYRDYNLEQVNNFLKKCPRDRLRQATVVVDQKVTKILFCKANQESYAYDNILLPKERKRKPTKEKERKDYVVYF